MKIKPEHFEFIKQKCLAVNRAMFKRHCALVRKDPRVKDYHKRIRWDLLWHSVPVSWVSDNIYPYANDDHIDTAMKAIMKLL